MKISVDGEIKSQLNVLATEIESLSNRMDEQKKKSNAILLLSLFGSNAIQEEIIKTIDVKYANSKTNLTTTLKDSLSNIMDAINATAILNSNEFKRRLESSNAFEDFSTIKLKTIDSNFKKVSLF